MAGDGTEGQKPIGAALAKGLGPLEMEVLDVVWELGRATSRQIFEKMRERRPLGQSTVLTVLRRLSDRGILGRDGSGEVYVYSPVMERHDLGSRMIDEVVNRVFGGSVESVIAYLVSRQGAREPDTERPLGVPAGHEAPEVV